MHQRDQTYSSSGMAKHEEQIATLGRMADKLTKKGWRDIGMTMLECPALLSPFGGAMLEALRLRPPRWPLAVSYGLWWTNHQLGQRPGRAAGLGRRASRALLRMTAFGAGRLGRRQRRY